MNINQEEYELSVKKSRAQAEAVMFCRSHGLPESAVKETESGYIIKIEFNYK